MRHASLGIADRGSPVRAIQLGAQWLAWLAVGVAGLVAWWVLRASAHASAGDPVCLMRQIAHVPCPTCGMTRALARLAAGEWRAALVLHPWAPVVVLQVIATWTLWGASLARRAGHAEHGVVARLARWGATLESRLPHLITINATALLVLWIARLATGTLPPI